jgi:hypothetical protein
MLADHLTNGSRNRLRLLHVFLHHEPKGRVNKNFSWQRLYPFYWSIRVLTGTPLAR